MSLHRRRLLLSRGSISQRQDRESHCRHTNNKTMSHLKYFPSSSARGVQAIHRYFYVRTFGLSSTIPEDERFRCEFTRRTGFANQRMFAQRGFAACRRLRQQANARGRGRRRNRLQIGVNIREFPVGQHLAGIWRHLIHRLAALRHERRERNRIRCQSWPGSSAALTLVIMAFVAARLGEKRLAIAGVPCRCRTYTAWGTAWGRRCGGLQERINIR